MWFRPEVGVVVISDTVAMLFDFKVDYDQVTYGKYFPLNS
jgi:hypothetical protein